MREVLNGILYLVRVARCARAHAKVLGETSAQKLLQECIDQAEATDKQLTILTETLHKTAV